MKNGLIIALTAILMIIIAFIAVFVYNRKYLIMDGPGMVNENPVPASSGKAEGEEAGTPESVPEPKNEGEEVGSMEPIPIVQVRAGEMFFTIELEDNSSAEEFFEKIKNDFIPANDSVEEFQRMLKGMGDEDGLDEKNLKRIREWEETIERETNNK